MDAREQRLAENEALFREVNERVQEAAVHEVGTYDYFCECANVDCTFRIALAPSDYEAIRTDPKQFVVLPGHYTPEIENLVAKHGTHWIVRKDGDAGELVEKLDPRAR